MRRGMSVRRSRAAEWARVIGALALPVLIIAALARRAGMIPDDAVLPVIGFGFALAIAAVALAAYATIDVWRNGAEGAGAAIAAILYAFPVLALLGAMVAAASIYPRLNDIATDWDDPPAFAASVATSDPIEARSAAPQTAAYPDLAPRIYVLPIAEVYAAVEELLDDRGWDIVRDVPPPSATLAAERAASADQQEASAAEAEDLSGKDVMSQSRREAVRAEPDAAAPAPPPEPLRETAVVQAVALTPVLRFADDVVLRLAETGDGTRVDMRSASRIGDHDLGLNARRIKSFFADLDLELHLDPAASGPPPAAAVSAPAAGADPDAAETGGGEADSE